MRDATNADEVGPALDSANRGLAVLPKEKIDQLLTETSNAVGGLDFSRHARAWVLPWCWAS